MEPNLGSKTLPFFTNRHRETSNPPKTSQDPQNLLQDPSGTPPRLLQASPKRFQSITFRPNLAKSLPFSHILAQQHNMSTFKIFAGPNTLDAFHFSLLYIRGTLVSVLAYFFYIHRALRLVRDPGPPGLLSAHCIQCAGFCSFLIINWSLDVDFLWPDPQNSKCSLGPIHRMHFTSLCFIFVGHWFLF